MADIETGSKTTNVIVGVETFFKTIKTELIWAIASQGGGGITASNIHS